MVLTEDQKRAILEAANALPQEASVHPVSLETQWRHLMSCTRLNGPPDEFWTDDQKRAFLAECGVLKPEPPQRLMTGKASPGHEVERLRQQVAALTERVAALEQERERMDAQLQDISSVVNYKRWD